MREFVLKLVLLASVLVGVLAIDCHQCDSRSAPDCVDPYDGPSMAEDNMGECDDTDTHCSKFKIVEKVYDSGYITGEPTVTVTATRGCARMDYSGDRCKYITSAAGIMMECMCSTDGCNSGPSLTSSLLLTITSVCCWYVIRKLL